MVPFSQYVSTAVIVLLLPCNVIPGEARWRFGNSTLFVPQSNFPRTRRTIPPPVKLAPLSNWYVPVNDCVAPKLVLKTPLFAPETGVIVPDCSRIVPRFVREAKLKKTFVPSGLRNVP